MHTEKIWIVIVILVVVLVGANLLMLGAARAMRGFRGGEFSDSFKDATRPWKKEDEGLQELSKRVRDLKKDEDD